MNITRFWQKTISVIIYSAVISAAVFSQDTKVADPEDVKPVLAIIPVFSKDVPIYVPKVVDKLIDAKIDKIGTYSLVPGDKVREFLDKNGIEFKEEPDIETLKKYSADIGVDQILLGRVSPDGEGFSLETRIFDVDKGQIVLSDTETAPDLRGLDEAVNNMTRKVVQSIFPSEVAEKVEKVLDEEKDTKKEEQVKKNIEDFANLVEKDPEKALELFDEPARKALEDSVKDKVVKEEIQSLFEKEKAEKEHQARRKKEKRKLIAIETGIQLGNLFGLAAVNTRVESVLYWNYYMNNFFQDDNYGTYEDLFGPYQGLQSLNYLFSGGLNLWLSRAYGRYLSDTVMLSPMGRTVFRISSMMQITGYMALAASSQLGFTAQHDYIDYLNADSDFTAKYDQYRSWYTFSRISNYMTMGMWGLGITGITASLFLPGDKEPLILSDRSRRFLRWSQILVSAGNLASGIATNYRGKAEESWINDSSSKETVGESNYRFYYNTSEVLYYTSYAIYAGGAVLAYMGLSGTSGDIYSGNNPGAEKEQLSFTVIPAADGISAVFGMRF